FRAYFRVARALPNEDRKGTWPAEEQHGEEKEGFRRVAAASIGGIARSNDWNVAAATGHRDGPARRDDEEERRRKAGETPDAPRGDSEARSREARSEEAIAQNCCRPSRPNRISPP